MKAKKSAFANTSTGYGRNKHSRTSNSNSNSSNSNPNSKSENSKKKSGKSEADGKTTVDPNKDEHDKDLNSGFGDYLRTPEAFEMMKLFVFANTVMLIVTMAWPNIREQFFWLHQWWESVRYEQQL
ncbi:uncharacterized protein LOC115624155 [Scaptodrosophila lebanonensis]|uniref:Uncharacterized protein LOC115624155 n=1 Tax=Drosophila lebanonensis TaxID=7225 RepID=A0A6J2THX1_DROLE|nr:uncharacterized protein LOC115624155 [Scaptodrosophila lebanonensis]